MAFVFNISIEDNIGNKKMAALLFTSAVTDLYKTVSQDLNKEEQKGVRVKTMKEIIQESFFHGASRFGNNFIA